MSMEENVMSNTENMLEKIMNKKYLKNCNHGTGLQ